jgi:predicted MFS family arabinose efflux permease
LLWRGPWLTKGISDEPESGGGLIVGAIQLSILFGAALGGLLLDHISIAATFIGGAVLLVLASLIVGNGDRIKPVSKKETRREFGRIDQPETASCGLV